MNKDALLKISSGFELISIGISQLLEGQPEQAPVNNGEEKEKKGRGKNKKVEESPVSETEKETLPIDTGKKQKAFSIKNTPAADEIILWKEQWGKLTPAQHQEYLLGKIDTQGNPCESSNEVAKEPGSSSIQPDQVRAKLKSVAEKAGDRNKGYELLKLFGVQDVASLKSTDYEACILACDKYLNEPKTEVKKEEW